MRISILFNMVLATIMTITALGSDKELAEKQVSEQMLILKKIISDQLGATDIEIKGTTLIIQKDIQIVRQSHSYDKPDGSFGDYVTKEIVPTMDGVYITYGAGLGPYSGSAFLPPWPNIVVGMNYKRNPALALISIPEEEVTVEVSYRYGENISPDVMRNLHENILKEAGSFRFGRTFFKALNVAQSVHVDKSVFSSFPEATYNIGYILRKNGGQIKYGKLPDISTDSSTATPSGSVTTTPVLEKEAPATVKKEPTPTVAPTVLPKQIESSSNWNLWIGIAAALVLAGVIVWKYLRK